MARSILLAAWIMAFLPGLNAFGAPVDNSVSGPASAAPVEATAEPVSPPVPTPDRWAQLYLDRVALFQQENAQLPPTRKNFVFVGDSITQGFPLEEYFPGLPVLNRGIVSDGIGFDRRGVLNRMDSSIFDCTPSVVVLLIGVNDLAHDWVTVEQCFEGYRTIVDRVLDRLPEVKLVLCTVLPTGRKYSRHAYLNPRIDQMNESIRLLARERQLEWVDLHALYRDEEGFLPDALSRDGLHPSKEAYQLWADAVRMYLK